MLDLSNIIADLQLRIIYKDNIAIFKVKNPKIGEALAEKILQTVVDKKTLLLLSGGKTPQNIYTEIAKSSDQNLHVGAAALIDERYGEPPPAGGAENSNEKMLQDTGLLSYFEKNNIPFYGILQHDLSREDVALQYDETLRYLFQNFPKSVAVMGMGVDGHTAGVPAGTQIANRKSQNLVAEFADFPGEQKERITLTFLGLSMIDLFIVLVFGKEKKKAFQTMFSQGSEEDIPARFYLRPEIAKKTLFITDQKV